MLPAPGPSLCVEESGRGTGKPLKVPDHPPYPKLHLTPTVRGFGFRVQCPSLKSILVVIIVIVLEIKGL